MRRLMTVLLILSSPAIATPIPLPTHIRDGDTVLLDCGRIYVGELDLSNRRGVTVTTRGTCGRATTVVDHGHYFSNPEQAGLA